MTDPLHHPEKSPDYHAYLLRIWREEGEGWRVSLQSARTGERHGFANLQKAVQFLTQDLKQGDPDEKKDDGK